MQHDIAMYSVGVTPHTSDVMAIPPQGQRRLNTGDQVDLCVDFINEAN